MTRRAVDTAEPRSCVILSETAEPVIDKLFAATIAIMKEPEMQEFLTKRSVPVALSESPADFNAYVQSESRRWDKIIKDNKVRID